MSWLRGSPLRASFSRQSSSSRDSPPRDADPQACYDSFCKHWQQTHEIIRKITSRRGALTHDEILGIVNHVDQMAKLLLLELRNSTTPEQRKNSAPTHSPCLEYLLSENLLNALFELSLNAGRYTIVLRMEQLKFYKLLISHSSALLVHEPVARPILRLLEVCAEDILEHAVQKMLIPLLNQLCVAIMQNIALLYLFFQPQKNGFVIFTLLMPHVHKGGPLGQQARDAMLLCMSLSKKNEEFGEYIAEDSNVCPVLAVGLSALYSVLPRKLSIETEDWHRLTPDDVNDIPELTRLMDLLEFCNAVAQVAHPKIQKHLLTFVYQGFLVPVVGPALLQDSLGLTLDQLDAPENRSTADELVAATAYFDLFLRSVTHPGLLKSFVKFVLEDNYDQCPILDSLIQRISSNSRLCIVTLALFETLVDLNSEEAMEQLCLRALTPCSHVMLSQQSRLRYIDRFGRGAEKFLSLTPACCLTLPASNPPSAPRSLPHISTSERRRRSSASNSTTSGGNPEINFASLPTNYNSKNTESLYGNYHAYLYDARQKISTCEHACRAWSSRYHADKPLNDAHLDDWFIGYYKSNHNSESRTKPSDNSYRNPDESDPLSTDKQKSNLHRPETNVKDDYSNEATSTENILDGIKSFCEVYDDPIEEILSNFAEGSGNSIDCTESIENTRPLSAEEQAKLDADITELLSDEWFASNKRSSESRTNSPGDDEASYSQRELRSFDKRSVLFESDNEPSNTAMNSLLSLGESSGYESFAFKGSSESPPEIEHTEDPTSEQCNEADMRLGSDDDLLTLLDDEVTRIANLSADNEECDGVTNDGNETKNQQSSSEDRPTAGIFLDVILRKLECMTSNNVYVNLHLTGLISRLAVYPQPLIQSFFLNPALVFQPSIRSLFQVLTSLKHKIDQYLSKLEDLDQMVEQARTFLINREDRLVNARRIALEAAAQSPQTQQTASVSKSLSRGEPKRRNLLGQVFDWSGVNSNGTSFRNSLAQRFGIKEEVLEITDNGAGYRYYPKTAWESPKDVSPAQNVVLCAVVMEEWLKELAAISQEHAIRPGDP